MDNRLRLIRPTNVQRNFTDVGIMFLFGTYRLRYLFFGPKDDKNIADLSCMYIYTQYIYINNRFRFYSYMICIANIMPMPFKKYK